jgi:DNA-binding XRE family transcriptional regulator
LSYDHWAPWRLEGESALSPVSLEKEEMPDPARFDISGTEFSSTAHFRAIHTMGKAEQKDEKSPEETVTEEDDPQAKMRSAVSHAEEAASQMGTLNADPREAGGDLDELSAFIGKDTDNLTGARRTLQDLLLSDHEVSEAIEKNLAEWMRGEHESFVEGAANRLARFLLSYYMHAIADAIKEVAVSEGQMESAPDTEDNPLSDDELIGLPWSQKDGDWEDLYWEDDPPAPCRDLICEYLEGRSLEELASSAAYSLSVQLADEAFNETEGDPPSDGEVERYVQSCSGKAVFNHAVALACRTVAFGVLECLEDEGLSADRIEELLDVEAGGRPAEAPTPKPETTEYDPDPFQGDTPMAGLLAGQFSMKTNEAIREADGEPAPTYEGKWGEDSTGHPIRVEQLGNPYEGRATFRVQAFGEPDPAAVEASMGWAMLERMDMDTVWLNLLLLAYASATHRRGDRPVIKIERRVVERMFGFRNRNYTKKERAERIRKHVEALQSIFVQFKNVRRHGDKLFAKWDMAGGAPLWNLRMVAEAERDLFSGETVADWHLEAREGVWATEFLHNHGDQWAPLPKEWFKQIDRRGSRNYAQRLAAYLLFQFRINAKNNNRVKRTAQSLLEICGEDMDRPRDTRRRTELKRCLSKALDTLERDYEIRVHDDRVHMDHTSGIGFDTWKSRVVAFDPPPSMDGRLFNNSEGERPPLPDVAGDWKPRQIRRFRTEVLGETQSELGERLDVSKQYVSQLERGTSDPSTRVRKTLDALHARHE